MRPDPELVDRLIELVRAVAKVEEGIPIGLETHLVEDLGVDSLDLVGIFLEVQDVFGVTVSEDEMPRLQRLGDLVAHLRERIASQAA